MNQAEGQENLWQAPAGKIARQVVLPFGKSLEISLKSLKVRFFRSLITVSSLVLAVAFLGFSLAGTEIASGLVRGGDEQLNEKLVQAGYDTQVLSESGSALSHSSPKERWLIILSLLVCTVGIVNAQLMAVTERFREIGTMKCLGALDSFVLRLFLLEAGMQGLAGSLLGAGFGVILALLAGYLRFGFAAVKLAPFSGIAVSFGLAVGVGVFLSLVGVAYPALVAARMRPVEAMRAQE